MSATHRDPNANVAVTTPTAPAPPLSDRELGHGYIGLANQGCTCYLSSMLQFLFHIGYFRSAVYETCIAEEDPSPIPRALQELFFQLQERQTTGSTVGLTNSFEWSESEVFVQHDIHEMVTKLREVLEEKMKGTPSEGAINRLFEGKGENVIKTKDGTYTSSRPETFYDVILPVTGFKDLYTSLASHTEKTQLEGDCKYKVEIEGQPPVYKDAEKGYRFVRFPPVMCFHLKRFEMDMFSPDLETKKVNSFFSFPEVLDLTEFEVGEEEKEENPTTAEVPTPAADASTSQTGETASSVNKADFTKKTAPIYDLHSVVVHRGGYGSGHYYCFVRMFDLRRPEQPESHKAEVADSDAEDLPYTGGQWFEFDDERVRMVKAPSAIQDNYGGERATYSNGGGASAYVLVYLRRGFLNELLKEASPDVIPQRAKDELRRVMLEDERRAQEVAEAKRKVKITLVDDTHIFEHVRANTTELVRGKMDDAAARSDTTDAQYTKRARASGSATHPPGLNRAVAYNHVKIDKTAPLSALYEELAAKHGYQPQMIRLWTWDFHYDPKVSLRPSRPLQMYSLQSSGVPIDVAIGEALDMDEATIRHRFKDKPMSIFLYVEQRRETIPPSCSNVAADPNAVNELVDMAEASTPYPSGLVLEGRRPPMSRECIGGLYYRFSPGIRQLTFTVVFKKPLLITSTGFLLMLSQKEYDLTFKHTAELFASKDDVGRLPAEQTSKTVRSVDTPHPASNYEKKLYTCLQSFKFPDGSPGFAAEAIVFTVGFSRELRTSPGLTVSQLHTLNCLADPLFVAVAKDVVALPREVLLKQASLLDSDANPTPFSTTAICSSSSLASRFAAQRQAQLIAKGGSPAVDALSVNLAARASIPPYTPGQQTILMLKMYTPQGGNGEPVRYLGPLVASSHMCLRDYQSTILRMMGIPVERATAAAMRKKVLRLRAEQVLAGGGSAPLILSDGEWAACYGPPLQFFEESKANEVCAIDALTSIETLRLAAGNIVVVQLAVPLVRSIYRFPTAIGYYNHVACRRMVTIRLYEDPTTPLLQVVMDGQWTYGEVCDFMALKLSELAAEQDRAYDEGSPISNASTPSKSASLQSSASKHRARRNQSQSAHFDSAYLRLYATSDLISPLPAPDPLRSVDSTAVLDDFLEVGGSLAQDLFVEFLDERRAVLETFTQATLIPVDEYGCPYLGGGESIAGTTSSASAPVNKAEQGDNAAASSSTSNLPAAADLSNDAAFARAAAAEEVSMLLPPGSTFRDLVLRCFVGAGLLKVSPDESTGADVLVPVEGFKLAPHYTIVGVLRDEPSRPVVLHDHIYMDPTLPSAVPAPDTFSRLYRFVLMATPPLPGYDATKMGPRWGFEHFMDRPDPSKWVRIMCSHTDIADVAYYRRAKLWGTPFLVMVNFSTSTDECMQIMCDVARVQIDTLVSGSSKNLAVLLYTNAALHFNEVLPVVQYLKHTRSANLPSILVLNHKRPKKIAAGAAPNRHKEAALVLERKSK